MVQSEQPATAGDEEETPEAAEEWMTMEVELVKLVRVKADDHALARRWPRPIRVLLVDDHPVIRDALGRGIQRQTDLRLAGAAGNCQQALALTCQLKPNVLVLDLDLPDGNGWHLLEQLRARNALPATLVLSVYAEQVYASRLLRAGARGYLMKSEPLTRIVEAIRQVHAGYLVASPPLTSQWMAQALRVEAPGRGAATADRLAQLSDRELQVFALLGKGLRNKEVAGHLELSEKTVSTYKVRVMEKLGLRTVGDLMQQSQSWQGAQPIVHQHG